MGRENRGWTNVGECIGPLITRQGFLARSSGEKTLDLWSADWKIPAGHRIAVRVTDAIQGDPGTQLGGYLNETITVPPETMRDSVSSSFNLPPAQQPAALRSAGAG